MPERVLSESGEPLRNRSSPVEQNKRVETILKGECQKREISFEELRMGSWRGRGPGVRLEIAERLEKEFGVALAEVAWLLGVSPSAISKILHRIAQESGE